MESVPTIEAEITFLSQEEGGRRQLPCLNNGPEYRPHVVVDGGEYLGVSFVSAPMEVSAGAPFIAMLRLMYHPRVDYSALTPGVTFSIREGPREVGRGKVLRRFEGGRE